MLLRRTCFYLCVHLWLNGATCAADPGGADAKPPSVRGPRCARSVLEHYGKPMELLPLIAEMQGGIPVQACSLRDVQDALEARNILSGPEDRHCRFSGLAGARNIALQARAFCRLGGDERRLR